MTQQDMGYLMTEHTVSAWLIESIVNNNSHFVIAGATVVRYKASVCR
jgi:hypothetical protein